LFELKSEKLRWDRVYDIIKSPLDKAIALFKGDFYFTPQMTGM